MDGRRLAPLAGIVACLLVVALVVAPYLLASATGVATYYDAAVVGPWLVALFAVVTAVVLLAGVQGRTDPVTVAGAALTFGVAMVLIAAVWALSVPDGLVEQLGRAEALAYHRWALLLAAVIVPASAAWYAVETT